MAAQCRLATQTNADLLTIGQWVAFRYRDLCSRARMRHLRRTSELTFPKTVTLTVTLTQDSDVVGVTEAGRAILESLPSVLGRFLHVGELAFEVAAVVPGTGLRLSSPYPGASGTAAAMLICRYLDLPPGTRWLATIVFPRLQAALRQVNPVELAHLSPSRSTKEGGPLIWAEAPPHPETGRPRIELYPASSQNELLRILYWIEPPLLELTDRIPEKVDIATLTNGVLIDIYRWEATSAAALGQVERAALMRNMMEAAETRWGRLDIHTAADVDKLAPQSSGLRLALGARYDGGQDADPTMTAIDHILMRRSEW